MGPETTARTWSGKGAGECPGGNGTERVHEIWKKVNSKESKLTDGTLAGHVLLLHLPGPTTALCKNWGSCWLSTAALLGMCVEFAEFAEKRLKGFSQEDRLEHGPI